MSDHVRYYMDTRGTSHLVAVWTHDEEPDTENEEAYVWFVASQVQWVGVSKTSGKTEIVFSAGGNSLETHAPPTDVRWAIDYALNGGQPRCGASRCAVRQRARERGGQGRIGVYTGRPSPDPNRFSTFSR